jgi:hypothetical protein
MEITGLIFSILGFIVGVIGVLVSYFGWRYVKRSFGFIKFQEKTIKQLTKTPHMQNPYNINGDFLEQTKYCLFNFIQNTYFEK